MRNSKLFGGFLVLLICVFFASSSFAAAPTKVGVFNLQAILQNSKVGKTANSRLKSKVSQYEGKFSGERKAIQDLEGEIKKKSSAWSKDKREDKIRDLQKAQRDYKEKTADAAYELKQLQEKELAPLLNALKDVIQGYGAANGYALIIERMPGVSYVDKSIDITADLTKELDKKMK